MVTTITKRRQRDRESYPHTDTLTSAQSLIDYINRKYTPYTLVFNYDIIGSDRSDFSLQVFKLNTRRIYHLLPCGKSQVMYKMTIPFHGRFVPKIYRRDGHYYAKSYFGDE